MPEDDREDPVGKEGDAGDDRVQRHVKGEAGPEVWDRRTVASNSPTQDDIIRTNTVELQGGGGFDLLKEVHLAFEAVA
jgi:hypothetical protein